MLLWKLPTKLPNHDQQVLALIEEYDTYHEDKPTRRTYELVQVHDYAASRQWVKNEGRPEEGYGRRMLGWTELQSLIGLAQMLRAMGNVETSNKIEAQDSGKSK